MLASGSRYRGILAVFVLFVSASLVSASIYMWRDKDNMKHLTNVKPDWWTDDMDQMNPDDIQQPEGPTPFPDNFVGDKENRKFHKPSCDQIYTPEKKMAIPESKIIWFNTYDEAVNKGYQPCDHCNPKPGSVDE
jgi:hypothetical protein